MNSSTSLNVTPARKRKRHFELEENYDDCLNEIPINTVAGTNSCFTNAAFSSTPKRASGKRRILKKIKENDSILPYADLQSKPEVEKCNNEEIKICSNPYDVLRKPPKKKKRQTEEKACFENPALNLELPDKIFNPYEVVREVMSNEISNCFSNPALNLKVQDASVLCNPFEVQRISKRNLEKIHKESESHLVLNPFINSNEVGKEVQELTPKPCKFEIGLPFAPTIGCRIAFNHISKSQLTPTKLLAEKLVFSPLSKSKESLDSVSVQGSQASEDASIDIGKELDRYQLELENSINEAKLRKTVTHKEDVSLLPPLGDSYFQLNLPKKTKFVQKLCGISENNERDQTFEDTNETENTQVCAQTTKREEMGQPENNTNPFQCDKKHQGTATPKVVEIDNIDETDNLDELYGFSDADQEDIDFKSPVQAFVRAYTRPDVLNAKLTVSKESLESNMSNKLGDADDIMKKSLNVKNIIRKSIRKLMYPRQNERQQETSTEDASAAKPDYIKNNGFMNVIRQSLRRKPLRNYNEKVAAKENEISIIDSTERTMRFKSKIIETEFVKIEHLTNDKRHTLRSSIKKSTREVRNQVLKTVFNKRCEEYSCHK